MQTSATPPPRYAVLLSLLLAATAGVTSTGSGSNAHVKYFSFYGYDPVGQRGIANVQLNVFPGKVAAFNFSQPSAFNWTSIDFSKAEYNMSSFIDVSFGIWKGRSGVNPGWQAKITATVTAASSRIATGTVAGLFLGDEIVCGTPLTGCCPSLVGTNLTPA